MYIHAIFIFNLFFLKHIFYWSIVDFQCFRCTAKWFSYTYTHILFLKLFSTIGYYKILTIVLSEKKVKVAQSHLTLCDSMHYTVHGIFQARILEWVAFPFSRGSSQPRDRTQVSCIAGGFFTSWAPREAQEYWSG